MGGQAHSSGVSAGPAAMVAALCACLCLASDADAASRNSWFITSDGARLHYLEAGPADAETLVFVPGWTMPAWIWERQIEAFSTRYHVIAFDPRGQGQSDVAADGYEPGRRGRDLGELIALQGPRPVTVVAWSLGVLDTLAYVADSGDAHLAALVLVDNSVGEEPAPAAVKSAMRPTRPKAAADREQTTRRFVAGMFATPQSQAYLDLLTQASLHTPPEAAAALRAYAKPRAYWRDAVYSTSRPIFYVVRPRWQAQAANLVKNHPGAEAVLFETAGHALFVDEPERFNAVVQDFLDRRVWPATGPVQ